jgi:hypothetical protein
MTRILIIYPHWPPSNLVGVHRVRLIANELPALGGDVTVLTVDERDYEEPHGLETERLVNPEVRVVKVRARPVFQFLGKRLVGDIGLRAYASLRAEAMRLISEGNHSREPFHFVWFSLPSWYPALIGPMLHKRFMVPYGVDYQDPWVFELLPHERGLNRATFTLAMARFLEPIALKRVALVSGISDGYLQGISQRYPEKKAIPFLTAQLGFSAADHNIEVLGLTLPFEPGKRTYVYAGAHWNMGAPLFRIVLESIARLKRMGKLPPDVQFLFVGTYNPALPSIQAQAVSLGLEGVVRELPERQPYLWVQQYLRYADGAMVIGSVQPHYSASKVFQCLLTAKRVFAFFHQASEAARILRECHGDDYYVPFEPGHLDPEILADTLLSFVQPEAPFKPVLQALEPYSARSSASKLLAAIRELQPPKP